MPAEMASSGPLPAQLWMFHDERPGHLSQLRGLARALEALCAPGIHWLPAHQRGSGWLDVLARRYRGPRPAGNASAAPDIAVGAGHGTHRELLALRRSHGCFCCVLMRPSLPLRCFDAVIAPRHDALAEGPGVLATEGSLNAIEPQGPIDPRSGLILIGGDSQHHRFDVQAMQRSVTALCQRFDQLHWQLSDSRRTPAGFLDGLREVRPPNLQLHSHRETDADWVKRQLHRSAQVWVSEDSVSMLYEALSAGACTGLLPVPARHPGRVQQGVEGLLARGLLNRLDQVLCGAQPVPPAAPLREAERAAGWLLARWQQWLNAGAA